MLFTRRLCKWDLWNWGDFAQVIDLQPECICNMMQQDSEYVDILHMSINPSNLKHEVMLL